MLAHIDRQSPTLVTVWLSRDSATRRTNSPRRVGFVHKADGPDVWGVWAISAVSAALRTVRPLSASSFGVGIMERSEAGCWGGSGLRAGDRVLLRSGAARNDSGGLLRFVQIGTAFAMLRLRSRAGRYPKTSGTADGLESSTGGFAGILPISRVIVDLDQKGGRRWRNENGPATTSETAASTGQTGTNSTTRGGSPAGYAAPVAAS